MSERHPPNHREPRPAPRPRRPYEKPGFITHQVFERQSLSCAGCALESPGPPPFGCCLRS